MTSDEIRQKYLAFFKARGHAVIPSASLVPENDPTTLFNTAGMQPLVPFLLGEKHPAGVRLVDCQKCVRTGDIDDIGDNRHLTFFEMLGNWSLGDYFKKEAIEWSFEFLTSKEEGLGLDPKRFYVTVFRGEQGIPRDNESIKIWQDVFAKHGVRAEVAGADEMVTGNVRIVPLGVKDNFWIAGATGPCGGDTEMFYDTSPEKGKVEGKFSDLVDSFRLIEVWNDVFMEFNKTAEGKYEPLAKKNVDTGMGLERTTVVVNGKTHVFETDIFEHILQKICSGATKQDTKAERVVADHIRTATMMIADGVLPSNTDRGYILRRILRRAVRYADILGLPPTTLVALVTVVVEKLGEVYENLKTQEEHIKKVVNEEQEKFRKTLKQGMKEFERMSKHHLSGADAFTLFSSYGFPIEVTMELATEKGVIVNLDEFKKELAKHLEKHQEVSRSGADKKFKGGLASTGEKETQYHTTTHLLNAALRQVLGNHVGQKGSNITAERLRFDFSHGEKMTEKQKKKVEDLVNGWIKAALPVGFIEMPKTEAEKVAIHAFNEKYSDIVKVYSVGTEGNYISREFCGGPHVSNTSDITGTFKIQKEEAVSAGVRRIKAVLV